MTGDNGTGGTAPWVDPWETHEQLVTPWRLLAGTKASSCDEVDGLGIVLGSRAIAARLQACCQSHVTGRSKVEGPHA